MKYVLCYGDSNTWGCIPQVFGRFDFSRRWPGVMQGILGDEYHVYENALNGRTTVFEDPIEEGRNGKANFDVTLMQNAPLDLIILMLGINDVKDRFGQAPWDIGWGMDLLIQYVKRSACGRDGGVPKILLVPPVQLNDEWGSSLHYTVFSQSSIEKCARLPEIYRFIAERNACGFFDPNGYVNAKGGDGIHMNAENHAILGREISAQVKLLIG